VYIRDDLDKDARKRLRLLFFKSQDERERLDDIRLADKRAKEREERLALAAAEKRRLEEEARMNKKQLAEKRQRQHKENLERAEQEAFALERQHEIDVEREWARAIAAGEKTMSEKIIWQKKQATDALREEQRIQEMFRGSEAALVAYKWGQRMAKLGLTNADDDHHPTSATVTVSTRPIASSVVMSPGGHISVTSPSSPMGMSLSVSDLMLAQQGGTGGHLSPHMSPSGRLVARSNTGIMRSPASGLTAPTADASSPITHAPLSLSTGSPHFKALSPVSSPTYKTSPGGSTTLRAAGALQMFAQSPSSPSAGAATAGLAGASPPAFKASPSAIAK
jgi:hypothetical protein